MNRLTANNMNLNRGELPYTKSEAYQAYLAVYSVRHLFRRPAALAAAGTQIFQRYKESWPVIGITHRALGLIKDAGIKEPTGLLQRAHLRGGRSETWISLMQFEHSEDEFWDFFTESDKTILCAKEENANINSIDFIEVPQGLFPPRGFKVRFASEEIKWLTQIIKEKENENG